MRDILYTEEARDRIRRLPVTVQRRLKTAIERLAAHPELGKTLTGHLAGTCSYRTGDYRILYRLERQQLVLLVITVGHRKDVYRRR